MRKVLAIFVIAVIIGAAHAAAATRPPSVVVVRERGIIARYELSALTTQTARPGVQVVRKLNLPGLARTAGKPLLVEVGNPFWPEGRTALADDRTTAKMT
jgi:hypothetical protein